jgi:hypothetical protein
LTAAWAVDARSVVRPLAWDRGSASDLRVRPGKRSGYLLAPVLLLVLVGVRRRRAPSPGQIVTVTTAPLGLARVSLAGGDEAPNAALGIVAAVGSGAAYAVSTHVGAALSRGHDALTVTTVTTATTATTATTSVAATALVPGGLLLAYLRGEAMTTADARSWLLLVYLGVVTMAFAYVLLFAGLRSTTSGTAVLIAVLLLDARLTAPRAAGALLILAAIATLGRHVDQDPQPQWARSRCPFPREVDPCDVVDPPSPWCPSRRSSRARSRGRTRLVHPARTGGTRGRLRPTRVDARSLSRTSGSASVRGPPGRCSHRPPGARPAQECGWT